MLEIIRPKNCALAGLAAVIAYFLASPVGGPHILPIFLSIFLLTGAGNAINDYFDYDLDKKDKPSRPIPSGQITLKGALYLSASLFLLTILISSTVSTLTLAFSIVATILLVIYPAKLKSYKLIGNLVVSTLVAIIFEYGASPISSLTTPIIVLSSAAFLSNLSREIVKDLEDYNQAEKNSLPKLIGKKKTAYIVAVLLLMVVPIGLLPYTLISYRVLIIACYVTFALAIKETFEGHYSLASRRIKTGMAIALLAFASTLL